jgi:hypothetical protein
MPPWKVRFSILNSTLLQMFHGGTARLTSGAAIIPTRFGGKTKSAARI